MKTIYEMNAAELRQIAKDNNMPGAWKANKAQMIKFLESIDYRQEPQNEPELIEDIKSNNYKAKEEKPIERIQDTLELTQKTKTSNLSTKSKNISKYKSYAAWVIDRETKEIMTIFGEANCRENFYDSIKSKYRVRLITKPEKLEEECKQWEIKHAQNKIKKNEKYAADKIVAQKMKISVKEYRNRLRESTKNQ